MNAMASQITSLMIIYKRLFMAHIKEKHQSSALLAFVRGIHRAVNSPHKWPATRKMFPFDDVAMWHLFQEADIAVAPLATTLARSQVIDFSETFMEVPLTLLVHKGITVNSLEELLDHPTLQVCVEFDGYDISLETFYNIDLFLKTINGRSIVYLHQLVFYI